MKKKQKPTLALPATVAVSDSKDIAGGSTRQTIVTVPQHAAERSSACNDGWGCDGTAGSSTSEPDSTSSSYETLLGPKNVPYAAALALKGLFVLVTPEVSDALEETFPKASRSLQAEGVGARDSSDEFSALRSVADGQKKNWFVLSEKLELLDGAWGIRIFGWPSCIILALLLAA